MKSIHYSAPAKIILSGEHSVTYGKPAFVAAISLRLHVEIEASDKRKVDPSIEEAIDFIEAIILTHIEKTEKTSKKNFRLTITSDIPQGRGMGSSAAFCVAAAAALLEFYTGKPSEKEIVNNLAYQSEKFFHGAPSGVDVSASCIGGLIFYRKEFEFLKVISSLNFKIPHNIQNTLCLIDSGEPVEPTAEMIKVVGKRYNEIPREMEHTISEIEKCTKRLVVAIVKEDIQFFQETLKDNEQYLVELGIVSQDTQHLLDSISTLGVGKVTGAGGVHSGYGMILFSGYEPEFRKQLDYKKITYFPFELDFDGLKCESLFTEESAL
jgi:mevalonate kinase